MVQVLPLILIRERRLATIYLPTSGNCTGQTAVLESQYIDLDQAYDFSFAYHMSGIAMENYLDIFANGAWQNDLITAIIGDQGTNWLVSTVDLLSLQAVPLSFDLEEQQEEDSNQTWH